MFVRVWILKLDLSACVGVADRQEVQEEHDIPLTRRDIWCLGGRLDLKGLFGIFNDDDLLADAAGLGRADLVVLTFSREHSGVTWLITGHTMCMT